MNPIPPIFIQEPIRVFVPTQEEDQQEPVPQIPYGWEDTKDWSWR